MVLTRYGLYLAHEKGACANTQSSYLRDLRQLQTYLAIHHLPVMEQASTQVLQRYVETMEQAGKSKASIARFLAAAKGYYAYLKEMDMRRDNPTQGVQIAPVETKVPQILTAQEMERLLRAPKGLDAKGYRDRSMLAVLYATGMRVGEMLALDITDVDLFGSCITCGTGKKERVLPLYHDAMAALSQYIAIGRTNIITDESQKALFVNMNGQRMSRQGFWKLVKHYQQEVGIDIEITPHTFRHSFAAHLLERGAEVGAVQQMMGHANVGTTRAYHQVVNSHLLDVYAKTHPKA